MNLDELGGMKKGEVIEDECYLLFEEADDGSWVLSDDTGDPAVLDDPVGHFGIDDDGFRIVKVEERYTVVNEVKRKRKGRRR